MEGGWTRRTATSTARPAAGSKLSTSSQPEDAGVTTTTSRGPTTTRPLLNSPRATLPGRPGPTLPDHRQDDERHLVGQLGRRPRRCRRSRPDPMLKGIGTRCASSSRRPSCSTCRASASTASTRRARRPALRRDLQAWPDGIVLVDQDRAAAGACASRLPPRRSTSTTRPARPRSAPSATRASRSASRPCARRPASAGCATSASSSTTPTRCSAPRVGTTPTSTRRSSAASSTRFDPRGAPRAPSSRASRWTGWRPPAEPVRR